MRSLGDQEYLAVREMEVYEVCVMFADSSVNLATSPTAIALRASCKNSSESFCSL
jgi:hypothetical protein